MIVTKSKEGFHIINHAAHGLLAGKIATHIKHNLMPKQWFETIIAITEHDDRQLNFDEKNYLSDIGIPLDFTEESSTNIQVLKRMQRVINSVKSKSSWTRLLVSYHLQFLYGKLRSQSKKVDSFLLEERKMRSKILSDYKIDNKKGKAYYEILRFCDRLSLILCKNEVPTRGRKLEINTSIEGHT